MSAWHTGAPPLNVDVEIETVDEKIIRGWFVSHEIFRSTKFVDVFEWLRWRIAETDDE